MTTFVSTHGVEFGDTVKASSPRSQPSYEVWAKFERAPERDSADGAKAYTFSTDDKDLADRVRKVDGYGIRELEADPEPDAEPAPEPPVS